MKKKLLSTITIFCFIFAGVSHAQEKHKKKQTETITVTAQKQEENVQDVPISISVFTDIDIEDKKIESVKDIAAFTSNLMLFYNGDAGNFTTTIRGIQSSGTSLSSSAGLFIDGIPILFASGMDEALTDIERIEVLKGPQGALYGKDTEAGTINIITKKPDNELRVKAGAEFGSDNKQQYTFSVSGPIVKDKFYAGVSGKHYEKDGFIKNTYLDKIANNRENDFGKITLRWTPTDTVDISLISSKTTRDEGRVDAISASATEAVVHTDIDEYAETDSFMNAFKIEFNNGAYQFNSITTQRKFELDSLSDYDYSLASGFHVYSDVLFEKFSQEFRLSSKKENLNWLIGLYADKDENRKDYISTMSTGSYPNFQNFNSNSIGFFASADYKITEKAAIVIGLRYDRDNKDYEDRLNSEENEDSSYSELSPKLTFRYNTDGDTMAYATIAKGYRSGGFHPYTAPGYKKAYDKETLWNYEIGCKTSFLNKRFFLNSALYYMMIDDMQVKTAVGRGLSYMPNAGESTSHGFESELTAKATNNLEIFASFGYNKTEFDDFKDYYGDYKGNINPYAPEYNYNLGFQYRNPRGYYARADFNGYGKTYLDNSNKNYRKAYNLVNTKLGYESANFDVYLYSKNLFDKNYDSIGAYGGSYRVYAPRRESGVQLTCRF